MQLHLENKVVVVTGSASGIAKSAARIFLEEGAKVAMLDMNLSLIHISEPTRPY